MAEGISKVTEEALLKAIVGNTSFTKPTKVYMALCQAEVHPGESGTEIESAVAGKANECVSATKKYKEYKRIEIPVAEWVFSGENPVKAKNKATIVFPTPTEGSAKVKYVALCTALTAGEVLMYGAVTEFEASVSSGAPEIAVEELSLFLK